MKVIPHYPQGEAGQKALARRVAWVQASFVCDRMKALNCPKEQKLALLNAVVAFSKEMEWKEQNPQEKRVAGPERGARKESPPHQPLETRK